MNRIFTNILFLIFLPVFLFGQTDSLVLTTDKLELHDIQPYESKRAKQKVYAATRSLKDIDELPFTIYVVTKEEIRKNGYRTLVDALKMQPGIRVSQPGNALEGETFMMRGLSGNVYAKILLNGNPIKPFIVKGMPIGAQLPIQQAERIEIIYGAMGSIYGTNASAGIINIVMEESDRPVYTQANLSMGSKEFANLDISFGGRLGKRKRTLQYSLYGNYTFRGDLKIQHTNDSLFNFDRYPSNFDFSQSQNYVSLNSEQIFNKLPHQSRMVGLNLAFRSMKFSIQSMSRRDHSAIGQSPVAASYSNPLNYIGEQIINGNFSVNKKYKKWGFKYRIGFLRYTMDNQSSFDYVYNTTSRLLNQISIEESFDNNIQSVDVIKLDSLTNSHYGRYFDDSRFSYAESNDISLEFIANFTLFKKLKLKLGVTAVAGSNSIPMTNFSRVPLGSGFQIISESGIHLPTNSALRPFTTEEYNSEQFSFFGQFYWRSKNLTLVGGLQSIRYNDSSGRFKGSGLNLFIERTVNAHTSLDPRIGLNYKLSDSWGIRAYYSSAIRIPSPHYTNNSFLVTGGDSAPVQVALPKLNPERTENLEVGIRWWSTERFYFDFSGFYTSTSDRIAYQILRGEDTNVSPSHSYFLQGYLNSGLTTSLLGFQSDFILETNVFDMKFNMSLFYDKTSGTPPDNFVENVGWSELPRMMRKTRLSFHPTKRVSLTFDTVVMGKAMNRVKGWSDLSKYRSIDILINYQINRNFRIFYKVNNVLDREYAGLSAIGNTDDLIYNPQQLRNFRVGMSYRVD